MEMRVADVGRWAIIILGNRARTTDLKPPFAGFRSLGNARHAQDLPVKPLEMSTA